MNVVKEDRVIVTMLSVSISMNGADFYIVTHLFLGWGWGDKREQTGTTPITIHHCACFLGGDTSDPTSNCGFETFIQQTHDAVMMFTASCRNTTSW